jgi:ribosome-associated protein
MKIIEMKKIIEKILDDNKANNIVSIDLKKKSYIADYMIIASGTSSRHLQSLSEILVSLTQVFWVPLAGIVEPDKSNVLMKRINSKIKLIVKKLHQPGHAIYDSHDVRKIEPIN